MTKRCEGKLALVTGGAQGLGRAHCIRLAQEGARVLATDINGEGASETAEMVNAEMGAGTAFSIAHDVTDPAQWEAAVDAAREQRLTRLYEETARTHGLKPRVARAVFELLLRESKQHQRDAQAGGEAEA